MKELYYSVSDVYDMSNVVMTTEQLVGLMDTVFTDEKDIPKDEKNEFNVKAIWLSKRQFKNLKDANI